MATATVSYGLPISQICLRVSDRDYVRHTLDGKGVWGEFLVKILVVLVLVSTISFSLTSVKSLARYQDIFLGADCFCLLFFTMEYILRILVSKSPTQHFIQLVSVIDLIAILPSWINICIYDQVPRLQFLRLLRLFKFLTSTSKGSKAVAAFRASWAENISLLLAATYISASIWIFASCLQYVAERENPNMLWCHPPVSTRSTVADRCICDDSSCAGDGCECEHRYASIPSSLFFTLIELTGTFQLASKHSLVGCIISTCCAIASVGVFSIPTSLCAAALSQAVAVITDSDSDGSGRSDDNGEHADNYGSAGSSEFVDAEALREETLELIAAEAWGYRMGALPGVYHHTAVPAFTLTPKYITTVKTLIAASCICSLTSTVHGLPMSCLILFSAVDAGCTAAFCFEHIIRIAAAGPRETLQGFLSTILPMADLLSWLPSAVFFCGGIWAPPTAVTLAVSLFRIIKYERYSNGFWILNRVMRNSWGLLSVGATATLCILVFSSALLYYTERNNPDPNVRKYYDSVPQALWTSVINIAGAPVVDYSIPGRFVQSLLAMLSVAVFAVPVGAIGSGFEAVTSSLSKSKCHRQRSAPPGESDPLIPRIPTQSYGTAANVSSGKIENTQPTRFPQRIVLYKMVSDRHSLPGIWFTRVSVTATVLGTIIEIISTCEFAHSPTWQPRLQLLDGMVVVWFSVEYTIRSIVKGQKYVFSALGALDLITTVPWYIARGLLGVKIGSVVDDYDGPLRAFRLLRVTRLDAYAPSLSLIDDAIEDCWHGLSLAMYAFGVLWFFFNAWLYLAEKNEHNRESLHFSNALSSLQYSGMLLTGSYGDMDLTLSGQICCCVAVLVAVGVATVPASVLATSFVNILREEESASRERKVRAALTLQRIFRLQRGRRLSLAGMSFQRLQKLHAEHWTGRLHVLVNGNSLFAQWYMWVNVTVILLNVATLFLESMSSVRLAVWAVVWNLFEVFFVVYFTIDYIITIITMPHNLQLGGSVKKYIFSFSGIAALLSIGPFYFHMIVSLIAPAVHLRHSTQLTLRILRIARIVGLDKYIKSFRVLSRVLSQVSTILAAAGIVAVVVWVGGAALFYYVELGGAEDGIAAVAVFSSVPEALFYCAMFLVGDWEVLDFTPAGSVLCVLLSMFGVAIFSVPVGILFEGFQTIIREQQVDI